MKHPAHRYGVTGISVHNGLPWMPTWSYRGREPACVSADIARDGRASTTFPIRTRSRRSIACARGTPGGDASSIINRIVRESRESR